MANFNKVILLGNLCADPVVRYVGSGTAVCDLRLAVNRTWFDKATNSKKEETTFVDVTLWGRDAEVAGEYLAKGRPVLIEGRLKLDTWDDKQTGQKRSKLSVVGEHLQLLGTGQGGGGQGAAKSGGAPAARRQSASQASDSDYGDSGSVDYGDVPSSGGGNAVPEDEVPF